MFFLFALPLAAIAVVVKGVVLPLQVVLGVVLTAIGFTKGGVAAGSIAAAGQSYFYGGLTGGIFSALQSAGTWAAAPAVGHVISGLAMVVGGVFVLTYRTVALGGSFLGRVFGAIWGS